MFGQLQQLVVTITQCLVQWVKEWKREQVGEVFVTADWVKFQRCSEEAMTGIDMFGDVDESFLSNCHEE